MAKNLQILPDRELVTDAELGAQRRLDVERARVGREGPRGSESDHLLRDGCCSRPGWELVDRQGDTDHRYLDPILGTGRSGSTRLAYVQYELEIKYDLSAAWDLPKKLGAWSISGVLSFNDALGTAEDSGTIQDEFFGGVTIGVSFGKY